jgi:SCP-2 sterol transfer family
MTEWLSPEWFAETKAATAGVVCSAGVSGRIQNQVTGGPDGDVSFYWTFEGGEVREAGPGVVADPDLTLTWRRDDAIAVWQGELDPSVAFMQGRLKVAGSMAMMLALLPAWQTSSSRDLRQRIAKATEF